ncbi:phosphotransferase [Glycomyces mayteni]|uniref:Phosphotransferase n=1 Tax=Glycomyces mayteni TaxID=543887 RepID=A0ABW2D4H6_9ACTN|nr:aminoglycoside phosphotransferase family protein [Glycomyces mayteni]
MDDLTTDEAVVRSLLHDQRPDLAGLELRLVDGGWGCRMWRLGPDLALRLPRTEDAPRLLAREHRWLPGLAPLLPLPVPVPEFLGAPTAAFPTNWIVTTWVEGAPADAAPVADPASAAALGAFLTALHRPAPEEAAVDSDRGVPLKTFTMDLGDPALQAVWDDALAAPEWDGPPVWLHADLHPANVVTAGGALSGVIDFGDLCTGDPAADLCAAWLLLPNPTALFDHYEADEATVRRSRGWALRRALGLRQIGIAGVNGWTGGKPTWLPAGDAALERLLAG